MKKTEYRKEDSNWKISPMCTALECNAVKMNNDGHIPFTRCKRAIGIQYTHE